MNEISILKQPKKLGELAEFASDCVTHRKCSADKKRNLSKLYQSKGLTSEHRIAKGPKPTGKVEDFAADCVTHRKH